jgi:hypothetical protein
MEVDELLLITSVSSAMIALQIGILLMTRKIFLLLILALFVGLACIIGSPTEQVPTTQPTDSSPTNTPDPANPQATFTAIAQTVIAEITSIAQNSTVTPTLLPVTATETPTLPNLPTATPTETATQLPTITPLPTFTPIPAIATTTTPCNAASFVAEINVSDSTMFNPNIEFTKIWRVKNVGSCIWTTQYALIHSSGERMSGKKTNFLSQSVKPGQTIDIAVAMEAPGSPNTYQGLWMLQSQDGKAFGVGQNFDIPVSVKIEVVAVEEGQLFNFAVNACAAVWTNENGTLPCPGVKGDENGFVTILTEPVLENRHEDEPTLWMFPKKEEQGWITGTYPEVLIEAGDHFISYVGCLDNSPKCKVAFRLDYRIKGTGAIVNLGSWDEEYDGNITFIDLDLSSLAGLEVEFIITVKAKASPDDDNAFWLSPHVKR